MAYEIGTATGMEDLMDKMVTFLTANATLVAAGQQWEALRYNKGNCAAVYGNMNAVNISLINTFRYDPRNNINTSPVDAASNFYCDNYVANTSYFTVEMKDPKDVTKIKLKANQAPSYGAYAPSAFNLHYSDDNVNWTRAAAPTFTKPVAGQEVEISIPASGPHKYWRVTLVAGGNGSGRVGWYYFLMLDSTNTVVNFHGGDVIFKSRGFSGTQEVYTGLRVIKSPVNSWENIALNGYTGFNAEEPSWDLQPGSIRGYGVDPVRSHPMVCGWALPMNYWFVATGNSFRFCIKVSTVYEAGYIGLLLPYSTPGQYPYPLAVGGSTFTSTGDYSYSAVRRAHGVYCCPGSDTTASVLSAGSSSLLLRSPSGSWDHFHNVRSSAEPTLDTERVDGPSISVATPSGPSRSVWPHCVLTQARLLPYRECLGGGYLLQPCVLVQYSPTNAVYGELEGTFHVSGHQVGAEDTSVVGGKTYVIFQNTYRTTQHNYWALSLD